MKIAKALLSWLWYKGKMIKAIILFCLMISTCARLSSFPVPDYQLIQFEKMAKNTKAKLLLVRNDTWQAVEVGEADIGSFLICIVEEGVVRMRPITPATLDGQGQRFVRCQYGKFYFTEASL